MDTIGTARCRSLTEPSPSPHFLLPLWEKVPEGRMRGIDAAALRHSPQWNSSSPA